MKNLLQYNAYIFKRVRLIVLLFIAIQLLLRVALLCLEYNNIGLAPLDASKMFLLGFVYDLATFSYFLIPYILYLMLLPKRLHLGKVDIVVTSITYGVLLYLILFDVVAELVFWDEFSVRFNFIAVDYLVYTQEVLANIWESYPIIWILFYLAVITGAVFYGTKYFLLPKDKMAVSSIKIRVAHGLVYMLFPTAFYITLDNNQSEVTQNSYMNEITKNGIYSLFSAFVNNELSYSKFYLSDYKEVVLPSIHSLLEEEEVGQEFVNDAPDDITRFVPGKGPEKRKNIILVTMESMSARYMRHFGDTHGLTPNLDRIADQSLFFSQTFATGTRTVRGLEAISLSIPPSPGRSIVKRPGNENLSSLGFVFKDRGYDTKFLYGGYGYFDNMNYFFSHNGFDIVDRGNFDQTEESFANAWGLCDEDLFRKVIKEANASYNNHTPFMSMVMTTSNHRPYTFPENEAGIPVEGGGRIAGIKYADYAIGKFLEAAEKEPWFNDTIFIFIADHTAGSAGKTELTVEKYHIPFMIYAPSFLEPRDVPNLTSQIDLAPILLGLLDFSYYSRFYGENILNDPDEQSHAFIANYQKLGFVTDNSLVILKPQKKYTQYKDGRPISDADIDTNLLLETIAYYKHTADWKKHISKLDTTIAPTSYQ